MNWSSIKQYCRRTVSRTTSAQQSADAAVMHKISKAVKGLSSSSEQVQLEAAEALRNAACEAYANRKLIVECQGSIAGLVQLLSSSSERVQVAAAGALSNLACEPPRIRRLIVECQGSIAGLVQLLSSSSERVQVEAAWALSNLACEVPANQKLIGEYQESIAGLVQLLNSSSEQVHLAAAGALQNLAWEAPANGKLIGECQGSIAGLVQLLNSSSERVQLAAAGALQNLAHEVPANGKLIGECQGSIAGLVKLLGSKSKDVQYSAAGSLANIAHSCSATQELIGKFPGSIPGLVQLLSVDCSRVQMVAAEALAELAFRSPPNEAAIKQCPGAITGLMQVVLTSSNNMQEQVVQAMSNLAVEPRPTLEIKGVPGFDTFTFNDTLIPGLVQLLGDSNTDPQQQVAQALRKLSLGLAFSTASGGAPLHASADTNLATSGVAALQASSPTTVITHAVVVTAGASPGSNAQAAIGAAALQAAAGIGHFIPVFGPLVTGALLMASQLLGMVMASARQAAKATLNYWQHRDFSNTDPQQQVAQAGGWASSTAVGNAPVHASAGAHLATTGVTSVATAGVTSVGTTGVTNGVAALQASSPTTVSTHAVVVTAGTSLGSNAQAGAAIGGAALHAAAGIGHFIPVFGPLVTGALQMAAQLLGMVHQAGLNRAKAGILAGRAQLIQGVLQDLNAKAQAPGWQLSESDQANIIRALQQVQTAFQAAQALLGRWVVPNKKKWYHQLERFAASKLDGQDLIEVDQELCVSYNQLASVLCTCGLFQLQLSASRAEAAIAACQQDIANFEQNLIQLAGGVAQVQDELQQHRQDLQHVLPQLRAMGVQLLQLDGFLVKMDRLAKGISGLDQKVEEVLKFVRQQQLQQPQQPQQVSAPKPDMLILPSSIKLLGGSLGKGGFGAVHLARYGREEVAVKVFFLQDATDEDMRKVYREAILLSRLQHHPNIIRFYGLITDPHHGPNMSRSHFNMSRSAAAPNLHGSLVMEKCDMDLHRLLRDDTIKLTLLDKVNIGLNIACGMCYLHHECGSLAPVIHGDLKPSNVLVNLGADCKPRQVKVCDFGISRTCQVSSTLYIKTTGKFHSFGSPQWMAPEVCQQLVSKSKGSKQPMTKEVDVYAFGILLFEVVTQRQPFDDEDIPMLCVRVIHGLRPEAKEWLEQEVQEGDTSSESGVLQRLVTLMESCWSSDPSARPSFKAIVCKLQEIAEQLEAQG